MDKGVDPREEREEGDDRRRQGGSQGERRNREVEEGE